MPLEKNSTLIVDWGGVEKRDAIHGGVVVDVVVGVKANG